MKKFTALTVTILMMLTVFASVAMADNTTSNMGNSTITNAVQIRGPVYNGTDIVNIITTQGINGSISMDADKFAAFFYDINDNIKTETLSIQSSSENNGRTIGKDGLVYSTTVTQTAYKYTDNADASVKGAWGNYSVIGFFADKYIPLQSTDASKLAKLIIDTDDKYSLKAGDKLDLGTGYTLTVKQVDVNGNKALMELDYNGQYVDDSVIDASTGDHTWSCKLDKVLGEDNVTVMKVHISNVFQGAVDSMVQIEGLWLIDFENPIQINSDAAYGKLDDTSLNGQTITIKNENSFSLSKNADVEIGNGLYFKVADSDTLRFYVYKQQTNSGTYGIRGTVATEAYNWTAGNFAGFFYDLKKDISTESLQVLSVNGRSIPEHNLVYSTSIQNVDYKYTADADNVTLPAWGSYPVIGFMAKEYVPLKDNDASRLAKLVIDSDDKYTLKMGDRLDLGDGYSLQTKQVDIDGKKVWLEFDYNGVSIDDAIISTDSGDHTWQCKLNSVLDDSDVYVLRVHVNQVFQGAETSVAQIDGLWLIDFKNAFKVSSDDTYGKLDDVSLNGATITITNKDTFTLTKDSDKLDINGNGMYFKVADSDVLRYYPFIEQIIGNGTSVISGVSTNTGGTSNTPVLNTTTEVVVNTSVNNTSVVTPNITAPVNETPTYTPPVVTETKTNTTPAVNNTTETTNSSPGFGVIPAIVGLLIVVYLVRRNP
jgi:S-layer protein (TIGR01567 family)